MAKDKADQLILDAAKKFRDDAQDYWQEIYDQGLEDKKFVTIKGAQWEGDAIAKRKAQGKPTLEINISRAYVQQQINTMRQNRPQAKVVPVDSGADPEVAKVLEGLIKDVEESSNFEDARDTAAANQVHAAVGFYRIVTDYINEKSFNQEPRFKPVENPQAVLIDPLSKALDGSDMAKALVCEWVDKDQVIKEYGKDAVDDFETDADSDWSNYTDKTVCIAEYFYKEQIADTLLLLKDGTIEFKSVLLEQVPEDELEQMIETERSTSRTEIKWAKVSGTKVLEKGVFPGQYIPIFPVYGEVTWVENKRHIFSLVHFAKDPQRLFNYWKSTEAHILQKNQDEMTIVDDRGIAGFDEWRNPSSAAYLRFKATDDSGNVIPYPTKIGAAAPPVGILNASESAKALIPDILNMHAPQMGQDVNQQSGVAIGLLQRQSDTAQFHFQDNINKTIRHSARVLIGLFPILYDTEMVRRIIGADGESELVKLNAQPENQDEQSKAINGVLNDMSLGRFDIRMDTGPSFNTQREQSFTLMMQLVQSNPSLFNIVADLIIMNSPLLNSKEIAERVKMLVPPQALGKDKIDPEQAKAQITQLDQLVQKLTADLESLQMQLNDKNADRNIEMMKVELQAEKDIQVAQINASSRSDVQELRGVVELLKQRIDLSNTPQNWLQQGEGVDNYAPTTAQNTSLSEGLEPPPDMSQTEVESPATEQGFLMPEESAQPENLAPSPDQIGESALIENGGMPPMEQQDGPQF
ncbi:portal protein p19 [Acinetobacter harbinensis]|uniref:portal protein n=1 Tax=Acinetobacter harbinensis TaxID=1353941 RepID=UPI00057F172F|nr:portal protein [Acinetobacter harbinensis]KWQ05494.1 portal protein p19 [Acinetobacter harbinensis]